MTDESRAPKGFSTRAIRAASRGLEDLEDLQDDLSRALAAARAAAPADASSAVGV